MRVKITYEITGEQLEELMKNENAVKAEIVLNNDKDIADLDEAVENWLKENNINGYAVSYARDLFIESDEGKNFEGLTSKRFVKAVKATNNYFTRNMRIGGEVVYTFIAYDGRNS